MEEGWSIKKLHRLLMLSSTYQQRSEVNVQSAKKDPENTLLWRMNRRRLDFEALRDTLLMAAGKLDLSVGGPAVELTTAPFTPAPHGITVSSTARTCPGFSALSISRARIRTARSGSAPRSRSRRYS
jgi:hypothetical protein